MRLTHLFGPGVFNGQGKLQTSTEGLVKDLKATLDKATPAIQQLSRALEVGEEIGRYEALLPLFKLLSEAKGSRDEVLPMVGRVMEKFMLWLRSHLPDSDLVEGTNTILTSIRKRGKWKMHRQSSKRQRRQYMDKDLKESYQMGYMPTSGLSTRNSGR